MSKNDNIRAMKGITHPLRQSVAIQAVQAGQQVLMDGLRRRIPVRTGRLLRSLEASKVGIGPHSVGGFVSVSTRYAAAVEKLQHFLLQTSHVDGPRAVKVMRDFIYGKVR